MQFENFEKINFYRDKNAKNKIYAEISIISDDSLKTKFQKLVNIDDPEFSSYLRLLVIPTLENEMSAKEIILSIKDYFRVYGCADIISTKVRTAGKLKDGLIEYALYNDKHEYVEITSSGYKIVNKAKHKFIKKETNISQTYPKKTENSLFDLLKPYVSAESTTFILFAIWLVQTFCEGNHNVLLIVAAAGCGKSTLLRIIRAILDPSKLQATIMDGKLESFLATLSNSYLATFDNCRQLSKAESDVLCVSATGGMYAKREFYTTNGLAVYELHNVAVLNGIDIIPTESDLAQRCILLNLKEIKSTERMLESDMLEKFEVDLPYILDRIFETISKAMQIIKKLKPKKLPRMADAYTEMLAIAIALGLSETHFEEIYFKNIDSMQKMRSNTDLVFAVQEYMTKCVKSRSFEGTATEVYSKIRNNFSGNKSALPQSVANFTRKVKSEYAAFLAAGFIVNVDDTFPDGTHIKIIKKK